uniref:CW domain-containing protein n=1 Tax=Caenorhabditis japonica TaxID=281687 RepID=A0A8R1EPQ9_CAEJA
MVTRHHFLGLLVTFYAFAFSNAESCKVRLIVVWGEPEDNGSEQVASWDKCKTKCLAEESCLLISQTLTDQNATSAPCRIHRFGNITAVKQLDKTSRKRVGFKKKFDNTVAVCPLSVDPPLFGEPTYTHGYLSKGTFYGFELTLYRREWLFRYYTSTCPSPSKIFLRCRVAVCLQVRWFTEPPYMADQLNASALCREGNGMGLSGNYDDKEYIWIRSE